MKKQVDYRTGRHCVFAMHVHLVFVLKYRRKVLTERVLEALRESFDIIAAKFDAIVRECDGEDDHVHLLVEYPPKVAVSSLVNSLKGASSRLIRKRRFPEVRKALWGEHFWSPSYFASSCGGAPLNILKEYIRSQRA
jgi:putative transposase